MSGGGCLPDADADVGRRRGSPFSLRLSEDERAALTARAGSMPLAAYIKSVVLAADAPKYRSRRAMPTEEQHLLAAILARLGQSRSAQSLDEIANHLRQGTLVMDAVLEQELAQALLDIAWMRAMLMQALGVGRGADTPAPPPPGSCP